MARSMFQSLPQRSAADSQVEEELNNLRRRVKRIRAVLSDAEEGEIREESVARRWLDELRDVAYDSQDVLDEVDYELLRYQLACDRQEEEEGDNTSSSSSHEPTGLITRQCEFQQQIVAKIKEIDDLFDKICQDGVAVELNQEDGQGDDGDGLLEEPPLMPPPTNFIEEQGVYGRDYDKLEVKSMLLSENDGDGDGDAHSHWKENVRVVSIVGIGGLGKTTLAQLVYNDDLVVHHFEPRMWVFVSDSFDVVQLTKKILEAALGGESGEVVQEFSFLQESLLEELQGKRFLLVLDDVWNESQIHWDALRVPLLGGAPGSRVLITTRSEKVSRICHVDPLDMYRLGCLSDEDSWSLFEHLAFYGRSCDEYPELIPIGRDIVNRCGGVPLAVKMLAGLLFSEFSKDKWVKILESELWELPVGNDDIFPALKLSYHHLPSTLKPCFAYCAVIPKDHLFNNDELVRMWMAHDHIKPSVRRCMEDVGRQHFEDLLQRSFFQERSLMGGRRHFIMHDLIHDLASSVGGRECCQVVGGRLPSDRARHLVFDHWKVIDGLLSQHGAASDILMKRLRTSRLIGIERGSPYGDADSAPFMKALDDMFMRMQHLRVLDLGGAKIKELPCSVGNLKHLHYLCIAGSGLTRLPESLGDLLNLQVLKISGELGFSELPRRLKDLVNLRHLDFETTRESGSEISSLSMMPSGIGRLTQLRTLPLFVMGEGSGAAGIEELTGLNYLQGKLEILVKSLDNWVKWNGGDGGGHDDYRKEAYILKDKQGLNKSLTVKFADPDDDASEPDDETAGWATMKQQQQEQESLLESLQPHINIKEIHIVRYSGGRFPRWMGHLSYERLERIHLVDCEKSSYLPALGKLPSLKRLEVWFCGSVVSVSYEFSEAASFPSLEKLILAGLWDCEGPLSIGTEGGGAFPCLGYLEINECPKLEQVKLRHLIALRELRVRDCIGLLELDYYNEDGSVSSLMSSSPPAYSSESHPQQVLINSGHMHIPGVQIMMLRDCPKLKFPPAQQQQQLLPQALWRFDVSGSPLLSEWARSHHDKLVRLTCLFMDEGPRGKLLSLLNVRDVDEACAGIYLPSVCRAAGHMLQKLELRWDDVEQQGVCLSPAEAKRVLSKLYLSGNSKELVIEGYQGRSFPEWVGSPGRLRYLEQMTLSSCVHCNCLPPLGRLPSLKKLHISRMPRVRHVGSEFCGDDDGATFQSLQTLEFHDMPQWQAWQEVEYNAFPNLRVLRIYNCPNLTTFKLTVQLPFELESDTLQYVGAGHFSRIQVSN